MTQVPSVSQKLAIEAGLGPVLVLAGPGAGKTFCLIERIRFLVEHHRVDPARICAFTFTNKAAGEISARLEKQLGEGAARIKRGTIHSFCAELLREFPEEAGLKHGFGIADDEYQSSVLRRIGVAPRWHARTLRAFTSHRFVHGYVLDDRDRPRYAQYSTFLAKRNLVDFDQLVLRTADLLRNDTVGDIVRSRWDCVLVDEFQDLNPVQYSVVRSLAKAHRNIFAVGDDEQSIYSWAGADRQLFKDFQTDFGLDGPTTELAENRRCPREVVDLARRLVNFNTPLFAGRSHAESTRSSEFPVATKRFVTGELELAWIVDDIRRDRSEHALGWKDYVLLYRTNEMGNAAESQLLTAGIPCRMSQGRALSEDPVVRYLVAALRVIAQPDDPIHHESFLRVVLSRALFDSIRTAAQDKRRGLLQQLGHMARTLPREHADGRKLRRSIAALRNLTALARRHESIAPLVDELLSQRVGEYRTMLEENCDELSDPETNTEVVALADRLLQAFDNSRTIWIPRLGGIEVGLKGILAGIGFNRVQLGGLLPENAVAIGHGDCRSLGIALGLFKAAQLIRTKSFTNHFRDFTAVDIETTDNDITRAELVEIAAVRVRDGKPVAEFSTLVRPRTPIAPGAFDAHGFSDADLANAPFFEEVWPGFSEFCGQDLIVAHNGHNFDFPILRRMAGEAQFADFLTYDTLVLAREVRTGSASLGNLARAYGIEIERAHHALDDTKALAHIFLALGEDKIVRARKTSLDSLLDQVGIALALSDRSTLCDEALRIHELAKFSTLGRFSRCLEVYEAEREACTDVALPPVDAIVASWENGERLRLALLEGKTAEERYPEAMSRLRPLLALQEGLPLGDQIAGLLERIALSRREGPEIDPERVNLLTLHATKGLEFSRVYVLGTDDAGFGRDGRKTKDEIEELRRLLYVGMTRTMERLVLTSAEHRNGQSTGGLSLLEELGLLTAETA